MNFNKLCRVSVLAFGLANTGIAFADVTDFVGRWQGAMTEMNAAYTEFTVCTKHEVVIRQPSENTLTFITRSDECTNPSFPGSKFGMFMDSELVFQIQGNELFSNGKIVGGIIKANEYDTGKITFTHTWPQASYVIHTTLALDKGRLVYTTADIRKLDKQVPNEVLGVERAVLSKNK